MRDSSFKIGNMAGKAMLQEVLTSPKPGLVDRFNCGCHSDMDLDLFLKSSLVITPYLVASVDRGSDLSHRKAHEVFASVRPIGISCEEAMFATTGGVNTQKGLIFSMGILCAGAGWLLSRGEKPSSRILSSWVSSALRGIVERELISSSKVEDSFGKKAYSLFGVSGIRGEAERGFPTVVENGLPFMKEQLRKGLSLNDSMVNSLFRIMTVCDDTNILKRAGYEGLSSCRLMACRFLELGGISSSSGRDYLVEIDDYFRNYSISPGGTADLLAVTEFLRSIDEYFA